MIVHVRFAPKADKPHTVLSQKKENRDRRAGGLIRNRGAPTVDQADRRQGTSIDTRSL